MIFLETDHNISLLSEHDKISKGISIWRNKNAFLKKDRGKIIYIYISDLCVYASKFKFSIYILANIKILWILHL